MSGLNAWSGSDSVPLTHLALSLRQGKPLSVCAAALHQQASVRAVPISMTGYARDKPASFALL